MIDAHAHLWLEQNGVVDGLPVYALGGGRSQFGREVRQMLPPAMTDGVNSAERFLSHMDFSRVGGAVITQEYIDGNQDAYLREVRREYPDRFRVCALYEENGVPDTDGMDGIKICGSRLADPDLLHHAAVFEEADRRGLFIGIDMADGSLTSAWSPARDGRSRSAWPACRTYPSNPAESPGFSMRSIIPIRPRSGPSSPPGISAAWTS